MPALLTLLNPEALLAANPGRFLDVSWEQRSFFPVAPSSVFGVNAGYEMGRLRDRQPGGPLPDRPRRWCGGRSSGSRLVRSRLGGLNANLSLGAPLLSRVLDAVPGLDVGGESSFRLNGEAAISLPDPNRQGDVYIDDYDGLNARNLSLQSHEWRRGSAAAFHDGAEGVLPALLSADNLAELTWQHTWIREDVGGDSLGVFQGFNPTPRSISRSGPRGACCGNRGSS